MIPLDRQLLLWINGLAGSSPAAFELALFFCGAIPLVIVVAMMLGLWWTTPQAPSRAPVLPGSAALQPDERMPSRRRCVALALAVAAGFVVTRLLAFAVDLPRPLGREELAVPLEPGRWQDLVTGMTGFGAFPSDHAAMFAALAVGLFSWGRGAGLAGVSIAILFSLCRVVVGFHYPSDMLAGAVIGATLGALAMRLASRPHPLLDGIVGLFGARPALMYPLLFVVALDFTQHFRLVFRAVFYLLFALLGGDGPSTAADTL